MENAEENLAEKERKIQEVESHAASLEEQLGGVQERLSAKEKEVNYIFMVIVGVLAVLFLWSLLFVCFFFPLSSSSSFSF